MIGPPLRPSLDRLGKPVRSVGDVGDVGVGSCHVVRGPVPCSFEAKAVLAMDPSTDGTEMVEVHSSAVTPFGSVLAIASLAEPVLDLPELDGRVLRSRTQSGDEAEALGLEVGDRREALAGVVDGEPLRGGSAGDIGDDVDVRRRLVRVALVVTPVELRNDAYHRWRSEAPGVTGLDLDTEAVIDRALRGEVIGYNSRSKTTYSEGEFVLSELAAASRDALDAFVARMSPFLDSWWNAFQAAQASHQRV